MFIRISVKLKMTQEDFLYFLNILKRVIKTMECDRNPGFTLAESLKAIIYKIQIDILIRSKY